MQWKRKSCGRIPCESTYRVNIWRVNTHCTNICLKHYIALNPDYPSTKGAFIKWSYTKYAIPNKIAAPNRVQVT